jgi:hypothetical protein
VGATAENHEKDGGKHEEAADRHPQDAESVEMALQARLGNAADRIADLPAAVWAGDGIRLHLGSATVAEH